MGHAVCVVVLLRKRQEDDCIKPDLTSIAFESAIRSRTDTSLRSNKPSETFSAIFIDAAFDARVPTYLHTVPPSDVVMFVGL